MLPVPSLHRKGPACGPGNDLYQLLAACSSGQSLFLKYGCSKPAAAAVAKPEAITECTTVVLVSEDCYG